MASQPRAEGPSAASVRQPHRRLISRWPAALIGRSLLGLLRWAFPAGAVVGDPANSTLFAVGRYRLDPAMAAVAASWPSLAMAPASAGACCARHSQGGPYGVLWPLKRPDRPAFAGVSGQLGPRRPWLSVPLQAAGGLITACCIAIRLVGRPLGAAPAATPC